MVPSLKIFIIAAVWAGVSVYLPVIYKNNVWSIDASLLTAQQFMLVLALIIPFEIRDLRYDSTNLGTLPQVIGIKKTKQFGLLMVLGCVFLEFFKETENLPGSLLHFFILVITAVAVLKATTNQHRYYASFFVEGIPILWFLLSLVF